jgi:hypothetical protein
LRIRDLQKADAAGQPLPLDLQFVSVDTGKLAGNALSTNVDLLELSDPAVQLDPELKQVFDQVFQKARSEAALVPIALAITNIGSSGIRNLHIEVSITASEGSFRVSNSAPSRSVGHYNYDFIFHPTEPSELERKLEKLTEQGLTKEGDEWRFHVDWDALQPERVRYVQPFTFLEVLSACKASFRAKVYADNFTSPIDLQAEVAVAVQSRKVQTDALVETAKKVSDQAKRSTVINTTVGGWNRSQAIKTSGNIT